MTKLHARERPFETERKALIELEWTIVKFRFLDHEGVPIAYADFDVEGDAEHANVDSLPTLEDGRVEISMAPECETIWLESTFPFGPDHRRIGGLADWRIGGFIIGPIERTSNLQTVRLKAPTIIWGRVLAPDGTPLQGELVLAFPVLPNSTDEIWPFATYFSERDGSFELGHLQMDEYMHCLRGNRKYVVLNKKRVRAASTKIELH